METSTGLWKLLMAQSRNREDTSRTQRSQSLTTESKSLRDLIPTSEKMVPPSLSPTLLMKMVTNQRETICPLLHQSQNTSKSWSLC